MPNTIEFNPFLIGKFRFDCVDRPLRWIAALDRQYPISNSRRAMTDRNRLATGTLRAHFIVEVEVVVEIPTPSKVRMILFH